ncbi:MAG TPA: hypothetical protein VG733_07405, partial [Chthoniobacteraceae bacterium]|nr:hypothetical protein [Chthoniobacteraceae bacterium]
MKSLRNLLLAAGIMALGIGAVPLPAMAADDDNDAADAPKPQEPPQVWVPSGDLKVILAKNPSAVLLSREQYETLLHDALKTTEPGKEPPVRATLSAAHYNGTLNGDVLDVQAEFTVDVLSDNWAEVPLRLGSLALGDVKFDGEAALKGSGTEAALVIRGKGEHKITAEFMLPVRKDSGVSSVQLGLPAAGSGLFVFDVPLDTQVESSQPLTLKANANSITVSTPVSAGNESVISWHGTGGTQQGAGIVFQENSYLYTVDETSVQADLGIVLNAALGSLPDSLQIKIPAGSTPLNVLGNEVLKWTANDNVLTVDLTPGDRKTTGIRVLLETPTQLAPGNTALPMPDVAGVRRSAGKFAVIGSSGVKIKQIETGEGPVQAEGIFDPSIEQDPQFAAGYGFAVQPAAVKITVEKVTPRFSADLDTLVEFKREAIFVERTLALKGDEGQIFEANFTMPAGEELISVRNGDNSEPDWKADGANVKIRFSEGMAAGRQRIFKITSRAEPAQWPDTTGVDVGDLKLQGAEKVSGYLAIQADGMFRLETTGADGLEKRDGRTTPVRGEFAWFRRDAFQLHVKLARRSPEIQAELLAYALPVDGALDVNGQLGFNILYSGVKQLRVKVPADSAEQFYFDGAQIAERNRDGDTWTIVLQKEITGWYPLKFHAVIPFDESKSNFEVGIPDVQPLDVKQQAGTWAIEANTSTEITFNATGMNELDPLHAPVLPDYQPRHHVIGVYGYLGAQHSLGLEGVKHDSAPIITAVADKLRLDTVVSTSGAERHEAAFYIRTVGDQFLEVTLPQDSSVLSLTVDDQALKPVAEKPGVVRVQLPATLDRTHETIVLLVYETHKQEWKGSGGYSLVAPRLDARIPVLESHWRVWLPNGFAYTAFDSNLQKQESAGDSPLLLAPFAWLKSHIPGLRYSNGGGSSLGPRDEAMLLAKAQASLQAGNYADAYQRYDQVLSLDPGNTAAREGQEKVNEARLMLANQGYTETRVITAMAAPQQDLRFTGGAGVGFGGATSLAGPGTADQNTLITKQYRVPQGIFGNQTVGANGTLGNFGAASSAEFKTSPEDALKDSLGVEFPPGADANYDVNSNTLTVRDTPQNLNKVDRLMFGSTLAAASGLDVNGAVAGASNAGGLTTYNGAISNGIVVNGGVLAMSGSNSGNFGVVAGDGAAAAAGTPALTVTGAGTLNLSGNSVAVGGVAALSGTLAHAETVAGLLPLAKLDLARVGQQYSFDGFYSAGEVRFHYLNWWGRARWAWVWWVAGAIGYFVAAGGFPWRRLIWGALLLTFIP